MSIPYKRIAIIIGFVLLVAMLAMLLYVFFFKPTPAPITNEAPVSVGGLPEVGPGAPTTITPSGGGLPETGQATTPAPSPTAEGGLTETTTLVSNTTIAPVIDKSGQNILYYQPIDGKFYRVATNGDIETMTDKVFYNVEKTIWSPNRDAAVLEYPDGANIVYNFNTDTQVTLPKHWQEFSFSPDGSELAFKSMGADRDSRWLAVSRADGGEAEAIEVFGDNINKVTVNWSPNKQVVAYMNEATGADKQDIFFVGLNNENFKSMTVLGLGFRGQWTPDGNQLLYSASSANSDYKPLLWVAGASGDNIGSNRHSLSVNTWADKCAFSGSDSIICAVPQTLPTGAGLAPNIADTIPDNIYEIDLSSGQQRLLALPSTDITAGSVMVTDDKQWVFVQDKINGRIYKIHL